MWEMIWNWIMKNILPKIVKKTGTKLLEKGEEAFDQYLDKGFETATKAVTKPLEPKQPAKDAECLTHPAPGLPARYVTPQRFEELCKALEKGGQHILLWGESGVGKSFVARALFHEMKKKYERIAWVRRDDCGLRQSFIQQFRCSISAPNDVGERQRIFMIFDELNKAPKKTLLFIDNVNTLEDSFLERISGYSDLSIVITSQLDDVEPYTPYAIGKFDAMDGAEVFYSYYVGGRSQQEVELVKKLVEEADFNTLEIKRLAKQVSKSGRSITAYYQERHPGMLTLAELFDIEAVEESLRNILYCFAAMPVGVIPAAVCDWIGCTMEQLDALAEDGWLEKSEDGFSMHDKVRASIVEKGIPDTALSAFIDYVAKGKFFADFGSEHYTVVLRKIQIAEAVLEAYGIEDEQYADACHNLGWALVNMASYDPALEWYQRALDIFGEDSKAVADTHNGMGVVYQRKGDHDKALAQYQKALDIFGEDSKGAAKTHNNMGNVYRRKGDYDKALAQYRLALDIYDEDSIEAAHTLGNMGGVYYMKGNYDEAFAQYGLALKIKKRVLGENHPDTATTYNIIGAALVELNRYKEAAVLDARAYGIRLQRLGPDHPDTKQTVHNLHEDYNRLHPAAEFGTWLDELCAEADAIPDFPAWVDDLLNKINTEFTPTP